MNRRYITALSLSLSLALALAATTVTGHAQEATPDRSTRIGAFWSANFASLSRAPEVDGIEGRQWMGGGLSVDVPLVPGWAIEGRIFWNRRGALVPLQSGAGTQEVSIDYLSMPLLLKASTGGTVRPYVLAGAELSVRTRARVRTEHSGGAIVEPSTPQFGRADFAVNAGAGLERALARSRAFVETLYAHGLRNVTPTASRESTHTRTLTLLAGVRF